RRSRCLFASINRDYSTRPLARIDRTLSSSSSWSHEPGDCIDAGFEHLAGVVERISIDFTRGRDFSPIRSASYAWRYATLKNQTAEVGTQPFEVSRRQDGAAALA